MGNYCLQKPKKFVHNSILFFLHICDHFFILSLNINEKKSNSTLEVI